MQNEIGFFNFIQNDNENVIYYAEIIANDFYENVTKYYLGYGEEEEEEEEESDDDDEIDYESE